MVNVAEERIRLAEFLYNVWPECKTLEPTPGRQWYSMLRCSKVTFTNKNLTPQVSTFYPNGKE